MVVAIIWVIYYGNLSLQTTVYEIVIGQEHADLDGFTIVQISDLHNARFGNEQSRLLQAVAEQEPDSIPVAGSKKYASKLYRLRLWSFFDLNIFVYTYLNLRQISSNLLSQKG